MGLLNLFFKKKRTYAEVGHDLFELCVAATKSHLPIYEEIRDDMEIEVDEYGSRIEITEILITNMWSITKSLSGADLDEAIRCMHDRYFIECHHEENREDARKVLLERYEQYESLFDHETGQHIMLGAQVLANMYNNGEVTEAYLDVFAGIKVVTCISDVMVKALEHVNKFRICD